MTGFCFYYTLTMLINMGRLLKTFSMTSEEKLAKERTYSKVELWSFRNTLLFERDEFIAMLVRQNENRWFRTNGGINRTRPYTREELIAYGDYILGHFKGERTGAKDWFGFWFYNVILKKSHGDYQRERPNYSKF